LIIEGKITHSFNPWDEAVGLFLGRTSNNLIFDKMVILLTPSEFDRLGPLDHLNGKQVSILKTDLPDRPFIIRVIEEATESCKLIT
jgi:hypothetical protein